MRLYDAKDNRVPVVTNLCHDLALAVDAVKLAEAVEDIREEREAYEVDKADAKRKGEW